jgi:hypothetical protein
MKSAWLAISVSLVLLQACSQAPKSGDAASTSTPAADSSSTPKPDGPTPNGGPTPEQLAQMPDFARYYYQSQQALQAGKVAECEQLLDKCAEASLKAKNLIAYIDARETKAKLKDAAITPGVQKSKEEDLKRKNEAIKILEDTIAEYDSSTEPMIGARLDQTKFIDASMYALSDRKDKAEKIYKDAIKQAKAAKPVDHKRIAFCLNGYHQYLQYMKRDKESLETLAAAQAEYKLSAPDAPAPGKKGGPQGFGPDGGPPKAPAQK